MQYKKAVFQNRDSHNKYKIPILTWDSSAFYP